eukprot:6936906-Prymnesium_polylepis.1
MAAAVGRTARLALRAVGATPARRAEAHTAQADAMRRAQRGALAARAVAAAAAAAAAAAGRRDEGEARTVRRRAWLGVRKRPAA